MDKIKMMTAAFAVLMSGIAMSDTNTIETATMEMSGSAPNTTITVEIPVPRKFSVVKLSKQIRRLGFTKAVREALIAADAYEMFVGANYLLESDEDFVAMKSVIQGIMGLSGDQLEELLSQCIWEE